MYSQFKIYNFKMLIKGILTHNLSTVYCWSITISSHPLTLMTTTFTNAVNHVYHHHHGWQLVDLTTRTVDLPHCLAACWRPLTCPWPTLIGTIHAKNSLNHEAQSSQFTKKKENTDFITVPGLKVVHIFSRRTIYICNYLE